MPICLSYELSCTYVTTTILAWMSCKIAHPSSGVMHFIRVPLTLMLDLARHLLECIVLSDDAIVHARPYPLASPLS
jgi:hypothetical protein